MTAPEPSLRVIAVRAAVPSDAPEIARVHVESWRTTYRDIVPRAILETLSVERRGEFWAGRLADPGETRTWTGELDGRIVGFAATSTPGDSELGSATAELESIYLTEAGQSQGLGRRLLARAIDDLVERGFTSAILWVLTDNERARRFYEAAGWQQDSPTKMLDFDGTPIEERRYRIDLSRSASGNSS